MATQTIAIDPSTEVVLDETQEISRTPADSALEETEIVRPGEPARTRGDAPWSLDAGVQAPTAQRDYLPRIEGYDVKRVLGRGGMGVVYEAVQLKLRRRVALKLLPAVVASQNPDLVARFQREATAAARLHHSNIIPIYDYGESRDGYYYAMELILGESLASVIRRLASVDIAMNARTSVSLSLSSEVIAADDSTQQPIEREIVALGAGGVPYYRQVAEWVASIAAALDYAHKHGMIHRDIKPGNLMLAGDGRVVILDFGLVKTEGDTSVTVSGSTVGTFRYISPEQVEDKAAVDARCDQYALGLTMYELLGLRPAFPEPDQRTLLHAVLHREPTSLRKLVPSIPRELEVICRKAIEKSAKDRYASCADMAADLRRFLTDLPIQAKPAGPVRRAVKFVKRHRTASLAAAAVVLLSTSIAFGAWQRQNAHRLRLDGLLRDGVSAWQQRNWTTAEQNFRAILASEPDNFRALVNFAAARKDQYFSDPRSAYLDEAVTLLDRALRDQPKQPDIWNFKGVVLREQGKLDDALEAHQTAAQLDPEHGVTWINLATVRALLGDLSQAEKDLQQGMALKAGQFGPKAWHNLAAVQIQLGREEAAETIAQAIDHPPEKVDDLWRPASYLLSAKLHLVAGADDDAWPGVSAAITASALCGPLERRDPDNILERLVLARTKRYLALACLRAGRFDDAIAAADLAKQYEDPSSYADLVIALALARQGRSQDARARYDRAVAHWPDALEREAFMVRAEGAMLWFDSAAEWDALRDEAAAAVTSP